MGSNETMAVNVKSVLAGMNKKIDSLASTVKDLSN